MYQTFFSDDSTDTLCLIFADFYARSCTLSLASCRGSLGSSVTLVVSNLPHFRHPRSLSLSPSLVLSLLSFSLSVNRRCFVCFSSLFFVVSLTFVSSGEFNGEFWSLLKKRRVLEIVVMFERRMVCVRWICDRNRKRNKKSQSKRMVGEERVIFFYFSFIYLFYYYFNFSVKNLAI